jgi:uncharacterized membrane protein (DUF2068 family)
MRWFLRRQSLHALRIHRGAQRVPLAIRLIAIGKLLKSVAFIGGAVLLARLLHAPDLAAMIDACLTHLHIDPQGEHLQQAITWVTGIPHGQLMLVAAGMNVYAAVYLIEGLGLWFDRPWAEWLTVIATALFIPGELEHLIHQPSVGICLTLLLNLAVVLFLGWRIRQRLLQQHGSPATSRI